MEIKEFLNENKGCPVEIGDRFYRKPYSTNLPDMIEVIDIGEGAAPGSWIIVGKYIYHSVGDNIRMFSSDIFKDEKWAIKKKGK